MLGLQQSGERGLAENTHSQMGEWSLRGIQGSAAQQELIEAREIQFQRMAWMSAHVAERNVGLNFDWPVGVLLQLHPREAAGLQKGVRVRERELILDHATLLRSYAGKWVVIEGNELVAANADPAEAVRLARSRGIDVPYVFFVEAELEKASRIGL